MVSFQCEGCGDVLTKKKLDAHRGQCRTASFTCLDCMTNFYGSDYRTHTSCVSENQKYQGHLYKDKSTKQGKKTVKISEEIETSAATKPRKAYVEDAPDNEGGNPTATAEALPEAPPPPPPPPPPAASAAAPPPGQPPVNVFDFLVPSDSPAASKVTLTPEAAAAAPKKEVKMDYTPSVVGSEISSKRDKQLTSKHDPDYDSKGFSYGADPIPTTKKHDRPKVEYFTPAPKDLARDLERHMLANGHDERRPSQKSTEKKRKRHSSHMEEFELVRRPSREASEDAIMSDAPPASSATPSFHTGLTGGLTRLLSRDDYSGEENNRYKDTPAPSRSKPTQTYIVKESRAHTKPSNSSKHSAAAPSSSTAIVKVGHRRSSDESSRPRKHRRAQREYHDEGTASTSTTTRRSHSHHKRSKHRPSSPPASSINTNTTTTTSKRAPVRAIEYYPKTDDNDDENDQQMVLYRARAASFFMSFVTKGPESETGTSVNKALKRFHRERRAGGSNGGGSGSNGGGYNGGNGGGNKEEEEKELWKGLRLKRNERGEVVVFF